MTCEILDLFAKRHSFYDINSFLPLNKEEISKLIRRALEIYPSPFNSQSARIVLLFDKYHADFWKIVEHTLLKSAPTEKAQAIEDKISTFAHGAGTVLFYIDQRVIETQERNFPLYAVHFKNWGYQCNAILQFMIWCAFANLQIGASLQHYNPIIDDEVKKTFHISEDWELAAQMPFGGIGQMPPSHSVDKLDDKLIILN